MLVYILTLNDSEVTTHSGNINKILVEDNIVTFNNDADVNVMSGEPRMSASTVFGVKEITFLND